MPIEVVTARYEVERKIAEVGISSNSEGVREKILELLLIYLTIPKSF